jgi:glyceraldehyde 3-phosphate dehydrogenase
VDVVFTFKNKVTKEAINEALKNAAKNELKGILDYTDDELVSIDFTSDPHSSIIDGPMTMVLGDNQAKVLSWYDNEYGYSNRLLDLAVKVGLKLPVTA